MAYKYWIEMSAHAWMHEETGDVVKVARRIAFTGGGADRWVFTKSAFLGDGWIVTSGFLLEASAMAFARRWLEKHDTIDARKPELAGGWYEHDANKGTRCRAIVREPSTSSRNTTRKLRQA